MSDTATLSRLFATIEPDLEIVDREFQRRARNTQATPPLLPGKKRRRLARS